MKHIFVVNPKAGPTNSVAFIRQEVEKLRPRYDCEVYETTGVGDATDFVRRYLESNPNLSVRFYACGGDGTLNEVMSGALGHAGASISCYPCGSGNDFARDIPDDKKEKDGTILLNPYLSHLPKVIIGDEEHYFINGVGYGIDGYCCEEGDRIRASAPGQPINYTAIAIKGLLFRFKPRNAMVTVDGEEFVFPKAWLAPTMKGRYYGGGMIAAPHQDRLDPDGKVTLMTIYKTGKIRTLMVFPSIFKGEHIYHKYVKTVSGKEITVAFDKPCALQVDGETFLGVTSYTVKAQGPSDDVKAKDTAVAKKA